MNFRVLLTEKAEQDAERTLQWFCEQSIAQAGETWYQELMACIGTLERHPLRCGIVSDLASIAEIRELTFGRRTGKYRILYRVEQDTVLILRIWHSARDSPKPEDVQ